MDFYTNNPGSAYGIWILFTEIVICGVVPAVILITNKGRKNQALLWTAVFLGVIGVCLNRWVMVLQTLAVPMLPFEDWALYMPSWQEVATTILPVAYSIIMVSISYRYLPVFPQERELNPLDEPAAPAVEAEAESEAEEEPEAAAAAGDPELSPAES